MFLEVWQDIPSYEGYYQASNMGRIRRLPVTMNIFHPIGGRRTVRRRGGNIKCKINNHGRHMVTLCRDGTTNEKAVQRIILETFVGPCPDNMEACHRNDIKTDNRLENLYWGTREDNIKDKIRNNRQFKGEDISSSKLKEGEVWLIKKFLIETNLTYVFIGKMFKVNRTTIRNIKLNRIWKHVIYKKENNYGCV